MVSLFDKIAEIPKKQHSEYIRTAREYDPLLANPPSVGEMTGPEKPGDIDDKKMRWLESMIDQSIPSQDFFRVPTLLAMIVDLLERQAQVSSVSDVTKTVNLTVQPQVATALKQTFTVEAVSDFGYIYIPNNPTSNINTYRIYKELGTTDLLYVGSMQNPCSLAVPDVSRLTIQFDTDVSAATAFQMYLSVRPFRLTNPVAAAGLGANLFSPFVSTYWYEQQYTYGALENSVALTNNNIYISEFQVPRQLDVVNAGISVTTASITPGDQAKLSLFRLTDRGKFFPLTAGDVAATLITFIGNVLVDAIAQPTTPFVYSFMPGIRYAVAIVPQGDIAVMGGRAGDGGFGRSSLGQIFAVSGWHRGQAFAAATPAQILGVLSPDTISPFIAFQAA